MAEFVNQSDVLAYLQRVLKDNVAVTEHVLVAEIRDAASGLGAGGLTLDLNDGSTVTITFERKYRNG